jgi:antirestriction protein ArdC
MTSDAAELHRQLLEEVGRLRSSEEWLRAMVAAARFHDYSLGNWLLLWCQAEQRGATLTRPAGYRTWQAMGRQVRRGERGYRILAPITRRITRDEDETQETERIVVGFRVVSAFDISQTDGEPLPDVGPRLLTGDGDARLLDAAIGMIEDQGFGFSLGRLRGPNGQTRPGVRQVVLEETLEGAQLTKTTVHELAHVLLHADTVGLECRGRVEVEAEAVAYVVCAASGLDTSGYSVAYVAGWAQGTADPDRTLLATGESIVAAARRILAVLEGTDAFSSRSHRSSAFELEMSLDSDRMVTRVTEPTGTQGKESR